MTRSDRQSDIALYQPSPLYHPMDSDYGGQPEQQQSGDSLFSMIDDRLRGRWKFMLIIGTVLSVAMVAIAYSSARPTYRSTGAVRVTPRLDTILTRTPESRDLSQFSLYVQTQVQFIRGRRVLEHAAQAEAIKPFRLGAEAEVLAILEDGLTVRSDRNSELIFVAFDSEDARLAQAALNSVIESYYDIYGDLGGDEINQKLVTLKDYRDQKQRELRANQAEQQRKLSRYPTADLQELQGNRVQAIDAISYQISELNHSLTLLADRGGTEPDAMLGGDPGEAKLEAISPRLAQLRQMRDEAQVRFDFVKQSHKPGSSQYLRAEKAAETSQMLYGEEYAETLEEWKDLQSELPLNAIVGTEGPAGLQGLTRERIEQEITALTAELEGLRVESQRLMQDMSQLADLAFDEGVIERELNQTLTRIQDLEVEENTLRKGRISIAQEGFLPAKPYADSRRKRVAAAAALGYMLSFGVFFLLGTIDRRAYGSRQLRRGGGVLMPGCLGVLPDLGRSLRDPESSDVAAHCVHQIRNQIEAVRDVSEGYVLAISSPYQGDGKTSIVMALGWSYAAAGYNTLLVDCDLVGRSLTRQLGMVGRKGLKEALRSYELNGQLAQLHVEHLSVLPVGADARFGPETIRKMDLEKIFTKVRGQYDVIIVDTGPMLGSLESTPVTAAADGVVLSVRRGRSRTRLEECVTRLASVGARYLGVILNCATRNDCDRYVSEASLAAAEAEASDATVQSLIHTSQGEQNALMVAMETTTRRPSEEE